MPINPGSSWRQAGYRLIYRVDDEVLYVTGIASGRRDKNQAYMSAAGRMG